MGVLWLSMDSIFRNVVRPWFYFQTQRWYSSEEAQQQVRVDECYGYFLALVLSVKNLNTELNIFASQIVEETLSRQQLEISE